MCIEFNGSKNRSQKNDYSLKSYFVFIATGTWLYMFTVKQLTHGIHFCKVPSCFSFMKIMLYPHSVAIDKEPGAWDRDRELGV